MDEYADHGGASMTLQSFFLIADLL